MMKIWKLQKQNPFRYLAQNLTVLKEHPGEPDYGFIVNGR